MVIYFVLLLVPVFHFASVILIGFVQELVPDYYEVTVIDFCLAHVNVHVAES